MPILDFHTHRTDAPDALISVDPRRFDPQPSFWYSVGYHPWDDVDKLTEDDFALLERCASHPQVLAIGETGIDRLRGAALDIQTAVFVRHLQLAADLRKPVVVHCVRAAQKIIARHKAGLTSVPMAIHGMRANANVASNLLDAGCYLSFGPRFNPDTLRITPLDRLLIETDDAPTSITINEVAALVASTLNLPTEEITKIATQNAHCFLNISQ